MLKQNRTFLKDFRAVRTTTPGMKALKMGLQSTWMAGDYAHFATYLEEGALDFLARLIVTPGTRMLDVGCGAGQLAIPAARAGARVTGVDIASSLIEAARERAEAEHVDARLDEGDAEKLLYKDSAFDLVVSLIGAMFARRPERVAAELIRVCKPGGRIVMGNWTPEGHIGQMFKIVSRYLPPSPLMASPMKWGDDTTVRELLRDGIAKLDTSKQLYPMRYPFRPSAVVEFFRIYYGPINRTFELLRPAARAALRRDLEQLWTENNSATDGTTYVNAEYLEVVAIRSSTQRSLR